MSRINPYGRIEHYLQTCQQDETVMIKPLDLAANLQETEDRGIIYNPEK